LCAEIDQAVRDRAPLDDKIQMVRSLYFNDKDPIGSLPWDGASDIHLPVLYEKIENSVPKLMNAFWGTEPIVHVRRVPDEYMPEETDNAEKLLNWGLAEDVNPCFFETTEDWFRNTLRDGQSTAKIVWQRAWKKTVEVHRCKAVYRAGEADFRGEVLKQSRAKMPEEILFEIFGVPSDNKFHGLLAATELDAEQHEHDYPEGSPLAAMVGLNFGIEFVDARRRHEGRAVFRPSEYIDEIDVYIYRKVLKYDSPQVSVMEHEDLIVPFRTADLQSADWVAHQFWMDKSEVRRRYESGELDMDDEDFERLISSRTTRQEESEENEDLKRQKDRVIGEGVKEQRHQTSSRKSGGSEDESTDNNKLLFYEVYICDDIDGDGDPIEMVYTISAKLGLIVSVEYLSTVFPHERRPFATLKYKSVSDRFYGIGMGEVLVAINLEVNTIVNYVNNNQELINNPFFFYVPAATMVDPGVMKGVRPGEGIPIADPNGIVFPKFQQEPLANLSAMDALLLFADRVTISPMVAGSPQIRNAPRTARGTGMLLSEGNIQLDNIITRWQRTGWEEVMHQLMGLYQEFMPDERWFYVTGEQGQEKRRATRDELRGRYVFSFVGNTVNTNREVLRQVAQVRYNTVMTHPDYSQDPVVRREALKDFLRHWSEGVDIDRLVPALPGQGAYQHPPMAQKDENIAMLHGLPIHALPTDMHMEHLAAMEQFERTPAFEQMSQDRVILFAMHKREHMEFMAQQQQAGQQAVAPGQGNNVPEQSVELGNLEGGVQ
jgi:hypothetical protein